MKFGYVKRLLAMLLIAVMLFTTVPLEVFASDNGNIVNTVTSDIENNGNSASDPGQLSAVNVSSAAELETAISTGAAEICIAADFKIDRTFYITNSLTIYSADPHTLTRQEDFVGDVFVVGENADGTPCENTVVLTVGTVGAQQSDRLIFDGNAANMTATVTGTVFFACLKGQVDLHPDITVTNCVKKGNVRSLESRHGLSNSPSYVGGAVGIVANKSHMNIYGGKYLNNGVEDSGVYGGAFFNHGTLNVYDGTYNGNFASRAGVFYNYRSMTILKGSFENNSATTNGGAIYLPSSSGAVLYVGGDTKTETAQVLFKNNSAATGGAISSSGTLVLHNTVFENNTATGNAGAVYGVGTYDNISFYDCTFTKNTAGENGGAIYITGTRASVDVELLGYNTLFADNTAGANGGAVRVSKSSRAYLRDITFRNSSAVNGGAMFVGGEDEEEIASAELNHVTFTGNDAVTTGGGIYLNKGSTIIANDITATENSAKNAGFLYNLGGNLSMYNSSVCNNTAENGSAMRLYTSAVANLYNCEISGNTCSSSNTSNAGALFVYTGGTKVTLNRCTINNNTSSGLGGGILVSGKSLLDMFDIVAAGNSAAKGGFMYETAASTVVTVSGLTVSGNTAATDGGPIIWGNTLNAKLYINKNNYTDKDVAAPYGDDYWSKAIFNKLTVYNSDAAVPAYNEYEQPLWDSNGHPDVKSARELQMALSSGFEEIRILRSFEIDRTYYITADTRIIPVGDVTLTRKADFAGDMFVVGESADGVACADGVTLTVGKQDAQDGNSLVIDGNKDNMTADVTGSAFFVCGGSCVNLYSDVSVINCEKKGNDRASEKRHNLYAKSEYVGGAVAIIAEQGEMNVHGGTYSNNTSVAANGGAIFSCGTLNIDGSTFRSNAADNGGAVYACYGSLKLNKTTIEDNIADKNGGAVMLDGDVVFECTDGIFISNTAAENGGAVCIITDATHVQIEGTDFSFNTAGKNGGVIYADGFSIIELRNNSATGNTADNGAVVYAAGASVDITVDGMTVNGNKASTAGDFICGDSGYATLWLNKAAYIDQNAVLDDAYWKNVISGSINVQSTSDPAPGIGGVVVDVSSSKQLENAINKKSKNIRIVADFEIDRTFYITSEIIIFSDEPHTLTRAASFGGDMFVVGESAGGSQAIFNSPVVKLTLGNPGSKLQNQLIIDGNADNMQATVKGSVFFVCYGGSVDLYDNVTIRNCYKQDNEKTYAAVYKLSRPNRVGGSVAVIPNGTVNVYGGNYKNNKVNLEDSSTEEGRNSSIGGVFYNEGNLYIHGGTFEGNEGARGAIVYNYQTVRITAGTFINNNGTKYASLYYAPSSASTQLAIGNTDKDGEKVLVKGNTAKLGAGAIYSSHFSAVVVLGNTSFRHNTVSSGDGGVVSVSGAFIAKNAEFIGNEASGSGGALYLYRSENDEITRLQHLTNCTLKGNRAKSGGAVYITSDAAKKYSKGAKVTVTNNLFEGNAASGEAGAIYVINKSKVDLTNNIFSSNTAGSHGGALSIRSAYVTVNGDQFINNSSDSNGGAMYLSYSSAMDINTHVTVNNAVYKNNSGVYGGVFYMTRRAIEDNAVLLNVKNTTFEQNKASKDGGVGLLTAGAKSYFTNVSFVKNVADDEGGAMQIINNSLFEMDGGSFNGNTAKYGGAIRMGSGGTALMNKIQAKENIAANNGGWLYSEGGVLKLYDSSISNNSGISGGAMYLYTGALSNIYNSVFEQNISRDTGNGGALFIYTGNTETVVHSCSFLNNEIAGLGGAIYVSGESLAKLYDITATGNKAAKGGFMYITKAGTVVDLIGVTVSDNSAAEGGNIIWGNTENAVLNIDKSKYTDKNAASIDEAYWATAIVNLLTVNDVNNTVSSYDPYEGKTDTVKPVVKEPVSVEDVFKLGKKSSDASINSSYDKLKRLDNSSNLMSRSTAKYPNINGKTVMVDTYVYPTNGKADNGIVGLGILLYQALLYKKANPNQEMYIDVSSYRFSVQAAININRNSRYFGYERDLVGKNYDEYGFVRLSYLLITAAKMGIHVNVIGQLDGYPISKSNPNFYEYFTQQLNDPCDPKYAKNKVIGDYLDFNFCYWTLDAKGGTDMMHTKMCTVSHYLDMNGKPHEKAVWSSSSNLDGVKSDGRNANWKQQTATIVTNHDELYRISTNYLRLISGLCGQEDVIEFQDTVNSRSTKQIDLIMQGRGNEIPADEQIVYIGTKNDDVFEMYFTPLGGGRLTWDETYNPYCKYVREMYESEDYILFTWNAAEYSGKFTLASQIEEMIIKSFHENRNPKNKIFSHMESFDATTFDDLVVGKDIGYKSFMERPYGKIHNKDVQLSYVKNGQRYFVTLLNSLNLHSGSMYYQSNFILVVKEKSCAENGVFSTIARYSTTGDIAAHSYGKVKTVKATSTKEGYTYRECIYCGKKMVERNVDMTKVNGTTFTSSTAIKVNTNITTAPRTIEAKIQIPKNMQDRSGVIVGNYSSSGDSIINLEGDVNGRIKLYIKNNDKVFSHTFSKDVRSGSPVNIAVTIGSDKATLYVNGSKTESVTLKAPLPAFTYDFKVGGDNRSGNSKYFKGKIYYVHMFAFERSASQIKKDNVLVCRDATGLIYSEYYTGATKLTTTKLNALTFTAKKRYRLNSALSSAPGTIEATIYLPKSVKGSGGVIFGNYSSSFKSPLNLEITTNGRVRLYFKNSGKTVSHVFKPDVRTSGGTTHIALTLSGKTATLFINGVKKETAKLKVSVPKATKNFCIGGDNRKGNTNYFKGNIYAVNIFSDVRTSNEIKKDAVVVTTSAKSLLYSAYMTPTAGTKVTMKGQTFSADNKYKLDDLKSRPRTIEATVALSKSVKGEGGVIFGNYDSSFKSPLNLSVTTNGRVKLYYKNGGKTVSHIFKPDIRTSSGTTRIALTLSGKTATLYINGVKKETATFKVSVPNATKKFCIGGDNRKGNTNYFKGKIYAVNVFSDVRTADEIKKDAVIVTSKAASLLYSGYFCNEQCGIASVSENHTAKWTTVYAATKTDCGIKQKKCTVCGKVLAEKEIMKTSSTTIAP